MQLVNVAACYMTTAVLHMPACLISISSGPHPPFSPLFCKLLQFTNDLIYIQVLVTADTENTKRLYEETYLTRNELENFQKSFLLQLKQKKIYITDKKNRKSLKNMTTCRYCSQTVVVFSGFWEPSELWTY